MTSHFSFKLLILCGVLLVVVVLVTSGDRSFAKFNRSDAQGAANSLEAAAHVTGESYCYLDAGRDSLILKLHVRLANGGGSTIILRKEGLAIAEILVSKKAAGGERNTQEYRFSPPMGSPRGVEPPLGKLPDERFVILKAGDSYEFDDTLQIPVARDATRTIPESILPGEHSLQIKYFTWLDSQSVAEKMRRRWSLVGDLLTDTILTEPMTFHVAPNEGMQICRLIQGSALLAQHS
ncbi:MAG: hypothetical protein ACRD4K_14180 [Candidatus Acidiferrales bacterium]